MFQSGVVVPKACGITAQSYITLFAYHWNISGDTLGRTRRHLLRVADRIGQCFLSRSSSLRTWVTAASGLPIGLCTFRSCPAFTNKFHSRVFRKSLCEIFLLPNEEKRMWLFRMVRSNRWKKSFFVHFHVLRLIEYEFTILSPLST